MESGILGFGIPNKAQGIRNLINDWNLESNQVPLTKTGILYLESGIHGEESRVQDCLGFSRGEEKKLGKTGNGFNSRERVVSDVNKGCFFRDVPLYKGVFFFFLPSLTRTRFQLDL